MANNVSSKAQSVNWGGRALRLLLILAVMLAMLPALLSLGSSDGPTPGGAAQQTASAPDLVAGGSRFLPNVNWNS